LCFISSIRAPGGPHNSLGGTELGVGTARRIALGGTRGSAGADERVHTVRRGDTLWRIAGLYQTTVGVLCALNDISPNTTLYPGVKLVVQR